jgi:hypothetical protein
MLCHGIYAVDQSAPINGLKPRSFDVIIPELKLGVKHIKSIELIKHIKSIELIKHIKSIELIKHIKSIELIKHI